MQKPDLLVASLLAALLACAGPAAATQEYVLPTLFDVTGVAEDDVLNIRAAPGVGAEVIGTLEHDARDIEVVAHDRTGRWGRINTAERSGWVAMHYLAYQVGIWDDEGLPESLHCLGTEPFWALGHEDEAVTFSTPEAPDRSLAIERVLASGIFRDPRLSLFARDLDLRLTAVIVATACSDGMSDRVYGLDATVVLQRGETPRMLTGCCSIAPR